jgi:RNA polymerase sigma-32 factor
MEPCADKRQQFVVSVVSKATSYERCERAFVRDRIGKDHLDDIPRFEMLEREQEYKLAKRWREHGDGDAAHRLVTSHLRFTTRIAMRYRGYGLPISEIISEGNMGLMQALNRFEPEKGFRFADYALWWITGSIQNYIVRSWSLVKIGPDQKRLFFKLCPRKRKLSALDSDGYLQPDQVTLIAKSLRVADRDVADMNRRLGGDTSLNAPLSEEGEPEEWQNYLVDQSPSPEAIVTEQVEADRRHKALVDAIDVLGERERRIFEARYLADEPLTLEDLAREFNVSIEWIRRIQKRAFEKVKKGTKKRLAEAIVHVRPRPKDLSPASSGKEAEQRRLSTFDAKRPKLDAALDKKLNICRC